jgi:aspartate/methionine/tyrosine aminotransferase
MAIAVDLARRVGRLAEMDVRFVSVAPNASSLVPAHARDAASAALDRGETHYTDRPGIAPLRQAIADRLNDRFSLGLEAGDVVVTCGATEARFVTIQQLLPSGSATVVALGHPERIRGACLIRDVDLVGPNADPPDGDALVYLPPGVDDDARTRWIRAAVDRDWVVLAEREEGDDAPHPAVAGLRDRTITIGDVVAGEGAEAWRVGYLAAPSSEVGPLRDFKQSLTICTTNVSQWGALALTEASENES